MIENLGYDGVFLLLFALDNSGVRPYGHFDYIFCVNGVEMGECGFFLKKKYPFCFSMLILVRYSYQILRL